MPKITRRQSTNTGAFLGYGGVGHYLPAASSPRLKTGKTYPYASAKRGVLPPGMAAAITDPEERKQVARAVYDKLRSQERK